MTTKVVVKKNTYFDSVSLMSISTKANQVDGVDQAFVAMGTEMNKEVLRNLGLLTPGRRGRRHRRPDDRRRDRRLDRPGRGHRLDRGAVQAQDGGARQRAA